MTRFLPTAERFLGLEDAQADPVKAGVVVVPVPFERTSSYVTGSAAGPAAILAASLQVELHDCDLRCEPWSVVGGIATLQPLAVDDLDGGAVADLLEETVDHWIGQDRSVVTLAGEHTGVVGAIRAYARRVPDLTVVQIDAHSDLRSSYEDDPWNHACAIARVLDFHRNVVQVAIRSESREDREMAEAHGLPVFRAAAIHRASARGDDWIGPIIDTCSANVYITLDLDGLDPSLIPATGTPEPGGLDWTQINDLVGRLCAERRVVGFDVCELAPVPGLHHADFTAARLVSRMIGLLPGNR